MLAQIQILLKFLRSGSGNVTKGAALSLKNQFYVTAKFILQTVANVTSQFVRGIGVSPCFSPISLVLPVGSVAEG